MQSPIRVRVAPSPTGEPHIGNVYTALVNEIFARKHGGTFVVRIEDTDQARSTKESEQKILDAFHWMGIRWDEGPDVGGAHGPYRQSERGHLYRAHAETLLAKGGGFKCFCTRERLEEMRREQSARKESARYDGRCLALTPAEIAAREGRGEVAVIRLKVPPEGECVFTDQIYGRIAIAWSQVDMSVLLKSDGMATYHLANVVDDHLMGITHVMRGEEWISSTPKHILLYQAFGYAPPAYAHLPLLRNPDRTKLSKRKNPTSISWFIARGYYPDALRNFLGLPFVSISKGDELMDRAQLEAQFDLANVAKGGGVFELDKLDWLNARWIREKVSDEGYREWVRDWAFRDRRLIEALDLAKSRLKKLSDLPDLLSFLLAAEVAPDRAVFLEQGAEADIARMLTAATTKVDDIPDWNASAIEAGMRALATELGLKLRDLVKPLYLSITGRTQSVPIFAAMDLLGRSVCRDRLRRARDLFDWRKLAPLERAEPAETD